MTNLYLKGISKILACKNFWEEEKRIVWMRKYKEFCVFEWVKFCFDDIQDKRKKRFLLKMSRKPLFYKHFLMIHFLTRFLPLSWQMGKPIFTSKCNLWAWNFASKICLPLTVDFSFTQKVCQTFREPISASHILKNKYRKQTENELHFLKNLE